MAKRGFFHCTAPLPAPGAECAFGCSIYADVPHPLANDSLNMGTAAMQDRVRAALEAIGDALGAARANDR